MTLVGLEYLKHQEQARSNRANEGNKRNEMLLDYDTSTRDRASKEQIASLDRASKEGIASADRISKENIAAADRAQDYIKWYNNYQQTGRIEDNKIAHDKYKFDNTLAKDIAFKEQDLQRDYTFKNADVTLKERELSDKEKQTYLKALEGDLKRIQTEIDVARYELEGKRFNFDQDKWSDENFRKWFQMLPKAVGELLPG